MFYIPSLLCRKTVINLKICHKIVYVINFFANVCFYFTEKTIRLYQESGEKFLKFCV